MKRHSAVPLLLCLAGCAEAPYASDVIVDGRFIWTFTWTPHGSSTPTSWRNGSFRSSFASASEGCLGATSLLVSAPEGDTELYFTVPSGAHFGAAVWTPASAVPNDIAWPNADGEVVALPWARSRALGKVDGALVFEVEGFPGGAEPCLDCEALVGGTLTLTSASGEVDRVGAQLMDVGTERAGAPGPARLAEPPGTVLCEGAEVVLGGEDTDGVIEG